MGEAFAVLDNREKAILIWIAVALVFALRNRSIRSSAVAVLRTVCSRQILIVLAAMTGYVSAVVLVARELALWNLGMTKDTLVWFFGPGLVMVFHYDQANEDPDFFRKSLVANLRIVLALEFLINFYVLNLFLELALVPLLFFIAGMLAYSQSKSEYAEVKRLMEFVMAAVGLSVLIYAVARLTADWSAFASEDTLRLVVLPVALTMLFLPFIYILAVYTSYEIIFLRIRLWITDNEVARYTKRQILSACLLRLSRINRFMREYTRRLPTIKSRSDAHRLLADFKGEY